MLQVKEIRFAKCWLDFKFENKSESENVITKMLQAWTKQGLTGVACSESSSASCWRLPLTPTGASSPSPGTRCSIQGMRKGPEWSLPHQSLVLTLMLLFTQSLCCSYPSWCRGTLLLHRPHAWQGDFLEVFANCNSATRRCMRTCWSNCRLRLSSYQSCLVRNTLLRQSSTFKPLLWHRPNLGHWPSGLLGSWTLQKFALLENLRRRRSGLCEQTQFFKLNILLLTRQDYVGIDFTIAVETFGETRIELLKPEGDSIPVTSENRFECFFSQCQWSNL